MLRRSPLLILLAVCALVATAGVPSVASAKGCSLSAKEKGGSKPSSLGTTYVTSLRAKRISCGGAKGVVKAFNQCRHKHGAAGHCGKVGRYSCSEKRAKSPVQYSSTASCSKGRKRVSFKYTQFT